MNVGNNGRRATKRGNNVVQLSLVKTPSVSADTVRCLRTLLADAEAGNIIGISYAVMARNRDFFYSSCGEAHRTPAWAAALSATLMHGTMKRIFGEDD